MQIVTRKEAKAAGLRHYFTGAPCVWGHVERRLTSNKASLGRHRERRAQLRANDPARVKKAKAASYRRNKPKVVLAAVRWARKNPEARKATQAGYRARQRAARRLDAAPQG